MTRNRIFPILDRKKLLSSEDDKSEADSRSYDNLTADEKVEKILDEVGSPMFRRYVEKTINYHNLSLGTQKLKVIRSRPVKEYAHQLGVEDKLGRAIDRFLK